MNDGKLPCVTACDPSDNLREQQLRAEIVWLRKQLDAMNRLRMSQARIEASTMEGALARHRFMHARMN